MSGVSGAGKTTLVERTAELAGNASRLYFDDYDSVSTHPPDLAAWLDAGADPNAWKTPRLADDLRRLRAGEAVEMVDGRIVEPADLVLVEEPFGRSRRETGELIDLAAHIEVPGDVLLARRMLRRLEEPDAEAHDLLDRLADDLRHHLAVGHALAVAAAAHLRVHADVVLDGRKPVEELAVELIAEIERARGA